MQVLTHSFADGLRWFRLSWRFYAARPMPLVGLGIGFLLLQLLALLFGVLLFVPLSSALSLSSDVLAGLPRALLLPFLCFTLLCLCRDMDLGRTSDPARFLAEVSGRWPMAAAGLIFFVLSELISLIILAPHREEWAAVMSAVSAGKPVPLDAFEQVAGALALSTALDLPVAVLFAGLPPLIGWLRLSVGKALFLVLVAAGRNWRALFMLVLALLMTSLLAILTLSVMLGVLGLPAGLVAVLLMFGVFLPWHIAAYYIAVREIFPLPHVDIRH